MSPLSKSSISWEDMLPSLEKAADAILAMTDCREKQKSLGTPYYRWFVSFRKGFLRTRQDTSTGGPPRKTSWTTPLFFKSKQVFAS